MISIQQIKHTAHEALQRQGRDDMLNALERFNKTGSELEQLTGTPPTLTREGQTTESVKRSG